MVTGDAGQETSGGSDSHVASVPARINAEFHDPTGRWSCCCY